MRAPPVIFLGFATNDCHLIQLPHTMMTNVAFAPKVLLRELKAYVSIVGYTVIPPHGLFLAWAYRMGHATLVSP